MAAAGRMRRRLRQSREFAKAVGGPAIRRQLDRIRKDLDEEYEKANGPLSSPKTEASPSKLSKHFRDLTLRDPDLGAGHRSGHRAGPDRLDGRARLHRQPSGCRPDRRGPLHPRQRDPERQAPRQRRKAQAEGRAAHGGDDGLPVQSRHEGNVRPAQGQRKMPQSRSGGRHAEAHRDRERPAARPPRVGRPNA